MRLLSRVKFLIAISALSTTGYCTNPQDFADVDDNDSHETAFAGLPESCAEFVLSPPVIEETLLNRVQFLEAQLSENEILTMFLRKQYSTTHRQLLESIQRETALQTQCDKLRSDNEVLRTQLEKALKDILQKR